MQYFSYVARDASGAVVKGIIEATNRSEFFRDIDDRGLTCINYSERENASQVEAKTIIKLTGKELILFCKKMGTMIGAGMSITNSLDVLIDSASNPRYAAVYRNIYEAVRGGVPLSGAMLAQGKSFPPLMCHMVESGEESGNIEGIFLRMSDYYDRQLKMSRKIKSASAYPKLLAVVSLGVVIALFSFVLPELFVMFEGMAIPPLTQFMIDFSNLMTEFWFVIVILLVILYVVFAALMRVRSIKKKMDWLILKLPLVGNLTRMIYSGRFSSTLAMLYASGLPLLETLRLSTNVIGNIYMEDKLEGASSAVGSGVPLSEAVGKLEVFDRMLPNMISIGEETGDLDGMLNTTAEYFEGESDTAIESLLAILGPVLLIILAIVVMLILVSVMMPIYDGYGTIAAG